MDDRRYDNKMEGRNGGCYERNEGSKGLEC